MKKMEVTKKKIDHQKKVVYILGDSMVKHVEGRRMEIEQIDRQKS